MAVTVPGSSASSARSSNRTPSVRRRPWSRKSGQKAPNWNQRMSSSRNAGSSGSPPLNPPMSEVHQGDAADARVEAGRDLGPERVPGRIDVARPDRHSVASAAGPGRPAQGDGVRRRPPRSSPRGPPGHGGGGRHCGWPLPGRPDRRCDRPPAASAPARRHRARTSGSRAGGSRRGAARRGSVAPPGPSRRRGGAGPVRPAGCRRARWGGDRRGSSGPAGRGRAWRPGSRSRSLTVGQTETMTSTPSSSSSRTIADGSGQRSGSNRQSPMTGQCPASMTITFSGSPRRRCSRATARTSSCDR